MDKIRRLIFICRLCFSFSFVNFVFMFNSRQLIFIRCLFFHFYFYICTSRVCLHIRWKQKQPAYFAGCLNFKIKIYEYFFIINAVVFYYYSRCIICNLDRS